MNKKIRQLLVLFLVAGLLTFLASCTMDSGYTTEDEVGGNSPKTTDEMIEDLEENSDFNNPLYENEDEGVEVTEKKTDESAFFGNWEATSDKAAYLYGNINLKISKGNTWTGNITDEKMNGNWKYNGTGITISNELITYDLFFDDGGILMLRDHEDPENLIVLTRVK